jgi:hypothetical protein
MTKNIDSVSIKIKPGAYKMYRHMNNQPWYALAEYVDNSLQSFIAEKERLINTDGNDYNFRVEINANYTDGVITIKDNAAGIDANNFTRSFEPANIPEDATGLSEFGMGLKIASIWFADVYTVRSSALGENVERFVEFDLKKVIKDEREDLVVKNKTIDKDKHYTVIELKRLSKNAPKKGNQLIKVKDHLSSIYRKFTSSGDLELVFDNDRLTYQQPEILYAPYTPYLEKNKEPNDPKEWKRDVYFDGGKYKVSGFIALQKRMEAKHSGISLFRRGRIIKGSHDEKWHPKILCGSAGSPRDKRLFGDLELDGFEVDYAKGAFRNMEDVETILESVKDDIKKDSRDILRQGETYRKVTPKKKTKEIAKKLVEDFKKKATGAKYKEKFEKIIDEIEETKVDDDAAADGSNVKNKIINKEEILEFNPFIKNGVTYTIVIALKADPVEAKLYGYELESVNANEKNIFGWVNLEHHFLVKNNISGHFDRLKPFRDIFYNLIIAEVIAKSYSPQFPGDVRKHFNKFISSEI